METSIDGFASTINHLAKTIHEMDSQLKEGAKNSMGMLNKIKSIDGLLFMECTGLASQILEIATTQTLILKRLDEIEAFQKLNHNPDAVKHNIHKEGTHMETLPNKTSRVDVEHHTPFHSKASMINGSPGDCSEDFNAFLIDITGDDDNVVNVTPVTSRLEKKFNYLGTEIQNPLHQSFVKTDQDKIYGPTSITKTIPKVLVNKRQATPMIDDDLVGRRVPYTGAGKRPKQEAQIKISEKKLDMTKLPQTPNNFIKGNQVSGMAMKETRTKNVSTMQRQKCMKTKFKPTPEMKLTQKEIHLSAYLFHPENDQDEILFKIGNTTATRNDFGCLCPPRIVSNEIIMFKALKMTWTQDHTTPQTTWSLPITFARDIRRGDPLDDIINTYSSDWLHPYSDLKYIYVPIDDCGHIYLMVISLREQQVYHFDSYMEDRSEYHRQFTMSIVCKGINQILTLDKFASIFANIPVDMHKWDIMYVNGISDLGQIGQHWVNSPVWVLDWMGMESSFQPNVKPKLDEDVVRMKVAVDLIGGEHNECWAELESRVEQFWHLILHGDTK